MRPILAFLVVLAFGVASLVLLGAPTLLVGGLPMPFVVAAALGPLSTALRMSIEAAVHAVGHLIRFVRNHAPG